MKKERLLELAGVNLNEKMATANMDSMIDDMKRLMSQGKTITLVAKESHISDRYKGEIVDYKLTHSSKKINEGVRDYEEFVDEVRATMEELQRLEIFSDDYAEIIEKNQEERDELGDALDNFAKLAEMLD